jgi:HK97 family phage portal protein
MKLIKRARFWIARQMVKAAAWPIFPKWLRYSFMDISFRTLAKEGYKKNSAVFACVQALAFGFSEPPAHLYRDGVPDHSHPLSRLLASPNPDMSLEVLLQFVVTYASIGGNCYLLKTHNAAGQVTELWPLHDGQMEPVPGGDRLISHYRLINAEGQTKDNIPREDVIHFIWAPDPLQPWRGMGALVPVAREVDLDSEMTAYTFSLLKNNAVPPLALVVPPGEILEQFQIDRMKTQWTDEYGGENRGKPAVLEGGMDVKQLSFDINKLAADAMRNIPESRISAAFRVPAVVAMLWVGMQQMTYNNVGGMMRYFTEQTLTPLWRRFAGTLTLALAEDFGLGEGEVVLFETSKVVALQQRTLEIGEHVDRQVRNGVMMRNEAREALSLPRVRNGDVFLVGISTIPEPGVIEDSSKALGAAESKASDPAAARRAAAATLARVLQSIRKGSEVRMAADVERFFRDLAAVVVSRARALSEAGLRSAVLSWKRAGWEPGQFDPTTVCGLEAPNGKAEQLTLPGLFEDDDFDGLLNVFGFWTYTIIEESWETWNQALGVELLFTRNDPAVVSVVETLGDRISLISEGTLNGVREILAEGYERGWSIDHIVAGDPEAGIPGLAETVGGLTYRGPSGAMIHLSPEQRARMVARTELGTAQNHATTERYGATGVDRVLVLDDGFENSHEFCKAINGKVVSLSWAQEHPLCHPNCVRALAPEYDAPVDAGAVAEAEKAGACPFG